VYPPNGFFWGVEKSRNAYFGANVVEIAREGTIEAMLTWYSLVDRLVGS
jgi:hypothetical protein